MDHGTDFVVRPTLRELVDGLNAKAVWTRDVGHVTSLWFRRLRAQARRRAGPRAQGCRCFSEQIVD